MSPDQIIVSILSAAGAIGAGVWAVLEGTKPIEPEGTRTEIKAESVSTVTIKQVGAVSAAEAHQAVYEATVARARAVRSIPVPRTVRVYLLTQVEFARWRDRYGAAPTARAFQAAVTQRFGSGGPAIFVGAEGLAKLDVLALITHEALHVAHGDRTHTDARIWWRAGGLSSAESEAIAKLHAVYGNRKRAR